MMLAMVSLFLLLQKLQYCTASGNYCKILDRVLNGDEKEAAKNFTENWRGCRNSLLNGATDDDILRLFKNLKITTSSKYSSPIVRHIAGNQMFVGRVSVNQLKTLIARGATISPNFFANVPYIEDFNTIGIEGAILPDDLLAEYDGPMKDTTWITEEQLSLFGSKLDKEILCMELDASSIQHEDFTRLYSVNPKCLRGIASTTVLSTEVWGQIDDNILIEWFKHFVDDEKIIIPKNFENLTPPKWAVMLSSVSEVHSKELSDAVSNAFSKIDPGQVLWIDRQFQMMTGKELKDFFNSGDVDM